MASGSVREGKNTVRNLDAAMKASAARSRANKAKQGAKKSDPNFLPF